MQMITPAPQNYNHSSFKSMGEGILRTVPKIQSQSVLHAYLLQNQNLNK